MQLRGMQARAPAGLTHVTLEGPTNFRQHRTQSKTRRTVQKNTCSFHACTTRLQLYLLELFFPSVLSFVCFLVLLFFFFSAISLEFIFFLKLLPVKLSGLLCKIVAFRRWQQSYTQNGRKSFGFPFEVQICPIKVKPAQTTSRNAVQVASLVVARSRNNKQDVSLYIYMCVCVMKNASPVWCTCFAASTSVWWPLSKAEKPRMSV